MSPIAVSALVMAGVTLYVGLYHAFVYLRAPERRTDRSFAVACFGIALYDVTSAGLYSATNVEAGASWQHFQVAALGFSAAAFLWFTADYTQRTSSWLVRGFTLYLIAVALISIFDRSGFMWDVAQPAIKEVSLPFGIDVVYYEAAAGPGVILQSLVGLLLFGYATWAAIGMYREGHRREAIPLLAALTIFFLGVFNDSAVSTGLYSSIYLIEFSYTSMIFLMAYALTGDLVEAAAVRRRLRESELQLRQAQKMESLGNLAGGIAHDFNNLLAPILGYADMASQDAPPGGALRNDLDEIVSAANQAAHLTGQLLALSRGQLAEPRLVDVNRVVRDFQPMLRYLVREDIAIELQLTPGRATIRADPGQLHQVLMNLAVNAIDAMPDGGRLTIGTATLSLSGERAVALGVDAGAYVVLSVDDTGTGIPPEIEERVFEPFFTTKERERGTGLGLPTVRGIASQHAGGIRLETLEGHGTRIEIYLPHLDSVPDEPDDELSPLEASARETILVVEDDEAVRHLIEEMLVRRGYRVLAPHTASEAVAIAENQDQAIDVLLTDVIMPDLSGPQLYDRLRVIRPALEVLYISGYADDVTLRHELPDPHLRLLQKPFTATLLTRRIREILDAAGLGR